MEVGLITLGVGLLIASFEIQFRYLETAKKYYEQVLNKISIDLDELLKERHTVTSPTDPQLNKFFSKLNNLLVRFTSEKDNANFPNNLFIGFISMGVYVIILGIFYDFILGIWNLPPSATGTQPGFFMIIILFFIAFLISSPIIKGLISLRRITNIS